jgi:hypothetical protein
MEQTVTALAHALRLDGAANDDGYALQLVVWPQNPGPRECELWLRPRDLAPKRAAATLTRLMDALQSYKSRPLGPRPGERKRCTRRELRRRR